MICPYPWTCSLYDQSEVPTRSLSDCGVDVTDVCALRFASANLRLWINERIRMGVHRYSAWSAAF